MRVWGFDLDGVLAQSPPASPKKWGYMNGAERQNRLQELLIHYAGAKLIFRPKITRFYVISARKGNADVAAVTEQWLTSCFGAAVKGLYLLQKSRSLPNVIAFKSAVIRRLGITDFAEDNVQVVKGLRQQCPRTHVWLFENGVLRPDPARTPRNNSTSSN